jgi:hypothetical protein
MPTRRNHSLDQSEPRQWACSMIGYVCGMAAPIISSQAGVSTNVPVYTSGALFLVTGVVMFGLPFETNPGA